MIKVVKIGGNIVDNPLKLDKFLQDFASVGGGKVLIHGGGKIATAISKSLGIETQMINGRRVTDLETLKVVTMVYAGGVNKSIVNKLNSLDCRCVGLSGADGDLIVSNKRSPEPIDYGYVGDPKSVNVELLTLLSSNGYTIVIAPITSSGDGELLNTNADTVAQTIAVAMAAGDEAVELVYCFEKQGVLMDVEDDDSVIAQVDGESFEKLKLDGVIVDGMLPKLENAFKAIDSGVGRVVICSAENISREDYGGTTITK